MSSPNFVQTFAPAKIIIHDVPRRLAGANASLKLDLSTQAEPVTGDLKAFLERKVRGSLARQGFDVVPAQNRASRVPELIADVLDDEAKFVSHSQEMAKSLHGVQTGVNPEGLLVVVLGKSSDGPALAILKVDRDVGTRLEAAGSGSSRTLTMRYISDLMITGRTRIFKSSVFAGSGVASLGGRVADDQRGSDVSADVATFFLTAFLGCELAQDPRVATKAAYLATERFIAEQVGDPKRKTQYALSLLSTMLDPSTVFRPRDFSETAFQAADRTPYRTYMADNEIAVDQAIVKNIEFVEKRLHRVQVDFDSGLMLIAPREVLDSKVSVEEDRVVINDRVTKAHGK